MMEFQNKNKVRAEYDIIKNSPLFDAEWYSNRYHISSNPAQHYFEEGWKVGFDPSKLFSTHEYLELYPDVAAAKVCPLVHYETCGKYECRATSYEQLPRDPLVPMAEKIKHLSWPGYLKKLCDKEGNEVLEVGSRVVTGDIFRTLFEHAHYTGFDIYEGPNVDVVGDAHRLSSYFSQKFDLIFTSAVFEHLAMPWIVANEMIKLLKPGGYIFVETHYCFASHERPWHFFQFSEQALKVLFSRAHGIKCIEAGVSNPMIAKFSQDASPYLRGRYIDNMFCHSDFLGQKVEEVEDFSFEKIDLEELVGETMYPAPVANVPPPQIITNSIGLKGALINYVKKHLGMLPKQAVTNDIGVKGALINYIKKHLPKPLWGFARTVKRWLRW